MATLRLKAMPSSNLRQAEKTLPSGRAIVKGNKPLEFWQHLCETCRSQADFFNGVDMGFFSKTLDYVKDRLGKTRQKISSSLSAILTIGRKIDDDLLNELEETLISDDIGVETTDKLITDLRQAYRSKQISTTDEVIPFLKEHLKSYWPKEDRATAHRPKRADGNTRRGRQRLRQDHQHRQAGVHIEPK